MKYYGGVGVNVVQRGIDYIINHEIYGRILLISDGFDYMNLNNLENDISILSTQGFPVFKGKECQYFLYNLEDTNIIYAPRYNTIEEYEIAKTAQKYNI